MSPMPAAGRARSTAFGVLGVMYVVPAIAVIGWATKAQAFRSIVALVLAGLLIASAISALARTWRWFFLVQLPLSVLSVAFAIYTIEFNMPPGQTLARILAGASLEELRGFLQFAQGLWLTVLLVGWSVVYFVLVLVVSPRPIFVGRLPAIGRLLVYASLPLTIYVAGNPAQMIDGLALNPIVGSLMFLGGDLPRASDEFAGSGVVKIPYHASRTGGEEVHILVVGESARRDSWSAYGYSRPTTPLLDASTDGIILLRRASADANLTDWAVPILLTGLSPEGFSMRSVRGNLFDLAKEGGYRTAWLVNQDIGISTSVGVAPDFLEYPPDLKANINGRHTLDEVLLLGFRREIARDGIPRFIGVHMMGSHWEYFRRYPAQFQRFGSKGDLGELSMMSVLLETPKAEATVVDAYDNTVLYTDWVLHQLIESAKSLRVPATLMYFPDHGEDLQLLDGATGHGGPVYTRHDFDIPAFIWVNEAYRVRYPDRVATMLANAGKEIRTHNVFYTEAELMGIQWQGVAGRLSFASPQFVPDASMKRVAGGVLVATPD
jgi:glucan phosphoethanolaminetransferase (alkaline phosphatase superfamily)